MSLSHPGKAKDIRSTASTPTTDITNSATASKSSKNLGNVKTEELPMVHSSPSKTNTASNSPSNNALDGVSQLEQPTPSSDFTNSVTSESTDDDKKMPKTVAL